MSADIDTNAPDVFTERLMQAQLGQFWRRIGPRLNCDYDPTESQQRYEKLCLEYLPSLHTAFAIDRPDMTWDNVLPKLPMQTTSRYRYFRLSLLEFQIAFVTKASSDLGACPVQAGASPITKTKTRHGSSGRTRVCHCLPFNIRRLLYPFCRDNIQHLRSCRSLTLSLLSRQFPL